MSRHAGPEKNERAGGEHARHDDIENQAPTLRPLQDLRVGCRHAESEESSGVLFVVTQLDEADRRWTGRR